jgi:N-acetyl-anhydromuramyl-L-alanine amidase AmpD
MIIRDYIASGTKRRSGLKNSGIKFLVAHDTGNPNSTARQNVSYFKSSANDMSASAHTFIDDIDVIECIPLNEKAWHVWYSVQTDNNKYGTDANDSAIGIELCYFPNDKERTQKAYDKYVKYMADLCKEYKLDPLTKISGHFQLDPARKTDPMNAFKLIGKTYDVFLLDVAKLTGIQATQPLTKATIGDNSPNIERIQEVLTKGNYVIKPFQKGLYDDNMACNVLFFQLQNNVADIKELSSLRGELIGNKTLNKLNL